MLIDEIASGDCAVPARLSIGILRPSLHTSDRHFKQWQMLEQISNVLRCIPPDTRWLRVNVLLDLELHIRRFRYRKSCNPKNTFVGPLHDLVLWTQVDAGQLLNMSYENLRLQPQTSNDTIVSLSNFFDQQRWMVISGHQSIAGLELRDNPNHERRIAASLWIGYSAIKWGGNSQNSCFHRDVHYSQQNKPRIISMPAAVSGTVGEVTSSIAVVPSSSSTTSPTTTSPTAASPTAVSPTAASPSSSASPTFTSYPASPTSPPPSSVPLITWIRYLLVAFPLILICLGIYADLTDWIGVGTGSNAHINATWDDVESSSAMLLTPVSSNSLSRPTSVLMFTFNLVGPSLFASLSHLWTRVICAVTVVSSRHVPQIAAQMSIAHTFQDWMSLSVDPPKCWCFGMGMQPV